MLKLIDLVILHLESDKLGFDVMQFAYQAKTSTTMCTWTVNSVVDQFLRNGTTVYGAAMDMSKAFDMVEWPKLFKTLMDRNVDCIFLRLILFIYCNQQCNVKWSGEQSASFSVGNGVRQGGVSSGIFFALYIDGLLKILRKSGLGCRINGIFYGAVIFADDIFLLSASRNGLQQLVNLCCEFVSSRNLKFGTNADPTRSKTKCIVFSRKTKSQSLPMNITLNGNKLPWVKQVKHLGHIIQSDNSMSIDIAQKRAGFIAKMNSILQEFHFVNSETLVKLMYSYATTMYGSNTWDLFSKDCEKLYRSFNVAIRHVFNLHRQTHRYFIESITQSLHLKTLLTSRFVTFYKSLVSSAKTPVRFLARISENDQRTVLGKTLSKLLAITGLREENLDQLSASSVKRYLRYQPVPEGEQWRIPVCRELIGARENSLDLPGFNHEEIGKMLA